MSADHTALVAALLAAGASAMDCMGALQAEGLHPLDGFQVLHKTRKDSYATVLWAAQLVSEAWEQKDSSRIEWLADALRACGIHPYSVEWEARNNSQEGDDPEGCAWWREHPDFPSGQHLPYHNQRDDFRIYGSDLSQLEPLELVFPHRINFEKCRLPFCFTGGLTTSFLSIENSLGLKDLKGVRLPSVLSEHRNGMPSLELRGLAELETMPSGVQTYDALILEDCPRLQVGSSMKVLSHLSLKNMDWTKLPNDWCITGSLTLSDSNRLQLPRQITLDGNLTLQRLPNADRWPEQFRCEGALTISDCPRLPLPRGITFGGGLCLTGVPLLSGLLDHRQVQGDLLELVRCTGDTLPDGIHVQGMLRLRRLQLKRLPPSLEFEHLFISECPQLRLPEGLIFPGRFHLERGDLDTLTPGLHAGEKGQECRIDDCIGTSLPEGMKFRGNLSLCSLPDLERLPEDLEARSVFIEYCPRLRIPEALSQRMQGRIIVR